MEIKIIGKKVIIPVNNNLTVGYTLRQDGGIYILELWSYNGYTGVIKYKNPILKKVVK